MKDLTRVMTLLVGSLGILLIVLTLSSAGFSWLLADRLSTVNEVNSVKQRHAINFRGSVHDRAILIRDIALAADAADMRASIEEIRALEAAYTASAGPLDAFFNDDIADQPAEAEILGRIKDVERRTLPLVEAVIETGLAGNIEETNRIVMTEARPAFIAWLRCTGRRKKISTVSRKLARSLKPNLRRQLKT